MLKGHRGAAEILPAALATVRAALSERIDRARLGSDDPALLEYVISRIGRQRREKVLVLFADQNRGFLADEVISAGADWTVACTARNLFARALSLDAAGFILAHNHPSGVAQPSSEDVRATRRIMAQAGELGIEVIDHLVVTGAQVFSMRRGGLI